MACEVNNKEINSQCAELLVRPMYIATLCLFIITLCQTSLNTFKRTNMYYLTTLSSAS